uniref:Uncharacterized protein n=1 Tax=Cuerna arida TaxID=1464854 RepID=A0A1B6ENN4_9HEMI
MGDRRVEICPGSGSRKRRQWGSADSSGSSQPAWTDILPSLEVEDGVFIEDVTTESKSPSPSRTRRTTITTTQVLKREIKVPTPPRRAKRQIHQVDDDDDVFVSDVSDMEDDVFIDDNVRASPELSTMPNWAHRTAHSQREPRKVQCKSPAPPRSRWTRSQPSQGSRCVAPPSWTTDEWKIPLTTIEEDVECEPSAWERPPAMVPKLDPSPPMWQRPPPSMIPQMDPMDEPPMDDWRPPPPPPWMLQNIKQAKTCPKKKRRRYLRSKLPRTEDVLPPDPLTYARPLRQTWSSRPEDLPPSPTTRGAPALATWARSPEALPFGCRPRRVWDQRSEPTPLTMSPTTPDSYALPGWAHEREASAGGSPLTIGSPVYEETSPPLSPTTAAGCRPRQVWSSKPRRDDEGSKPTGMMALPSWTREGIRQEIQELERAPRRPEPQTLTPGELQNLPRWASSAGCLPRRVWDRLQEDSYEESPTTVGAPALPDWARENALAGGCKPRQAWSRKPRRDDDDSKPTGMMALPSWASGGIRQEIHDRERSARRPEPQAFTPGLLNLPSWASESETRRRTARRPEPETFPTGLLNLPSWASKTETRRRAPMKPEPETLQARPRKDTPFLQKPFPTAGFQGSQCPRTVTRFPPQTSTMTQMEQERDEFLTHIGDSGVQRFLRFSPQQSTPRTDECPSITTCPGSEQMPSGRRVSLSGRVHRETSPPLGSPGL